MKNSHLNLFRQLLSLFMLFALSLNQGLTQGVYERGTFTSIPAGKHINHSYYGLWNIYFAVEDGVLVYNHHEGKWLNPITASDGLRQYPVLLVWEDKMTQDVWMVTPDYVYLFNPQSDIMTHSPLPNDPNFTGTYQLGVTDTYVIVAASGQNSNEKYSALFRKSTGGFETWGAESTLDVNWDQVDWINSIPRDFNNLYATLSVQAVTGGGFNADGFLHLDGRPQKSTSSVSALTGDHTSGEVFMSTYGLGIFHRDVTDTQFSLLPFGLLSPDVMSMDLLNNQIIVGGRAGLTMVEDFNFSYDEAIRDPVYDYSFITGIDHNNDKMVIAGRGGVFTGNFENSGWTRIITKKDLLSNRIYDVAAGDDGNIMVATERNAYLYHDSGLILNMLFPEEPGWPVFDVCYSNDTYFISTYYGLYLYDTELMTFTARLSSFGDFQTPNQAGATIDPVYESVVLGDTLWASTHSGLVQVNLSTEESVAHVAPLTPFKPRGLAMSNGRAWVGTDIGVYSFNPKSASWRHYTQNDGLISNFVTDIVANGDYIWLGTNLGLTRIKWRNLY